MINRKLTVISLLGLVFLTAFAALWWFLGDDAWVKGKIESTVSELTGRSLSIDGSFDVDWSMMPVLKAENAHLSNPPWAIHPDFASLERLEISIDLLSLFKDQVRVNYIEARNLVIALEQHGSEGNSWEFMSAEEQPSVDSEAPAGEFPVRIDRISLNGLTVLHEKPDRDVPLDFHLAGLTLQEEDGQVIHIDAGGKLGGKQFQLSGQLGPLDEILKGGKVSHDIRLSLDEITLQSQGVVEQLSTLAGANVRLVFSGPEIEWILTQLALPLFSHGDFDFRLNVQTEGEETKLDLKGDLGSLQAKANGSLDRRTDSADLTAEISGGDLGDLLEVAGVAGLPKEPFELKADLNHASGIYHVQTLSLESESGSISVKGKLGDWPQLLDSELSYSAFGDSLQSWGKALPAKWLHGINLPAADFELSGQIGRTGNAPASTDTRLRLGDSRIHLSGSLGRLPSMTGADLTLSADGLVNGALSQMAGIEGVPGESFNLKASLERDADYFYLRKASLDLENNHLELSGKSGPWPEHRDASLVFSLLGPDLSVWSKTLETEELPARAFALKGEVVSIPEGMKLDDFHLQLGDSSLEANGTIGAWPELTGTELSLEAKLSTLADFRFLPGLGQAPDLPLGVSGSVDRIPGGWAFRATNGTLGDGSFETEGKYTETDDRLQVEANSRVSVPNLARLGQAAGIENLPAETLAIKGFARYRSGRVDLQEVEGRIGDSQFALNGTVMNAPTWAGSEITMHVSGPDIGQLLAQHGFEDVLPFSVDGKIARTEDAFQVNQVKVRLGSLQALVDGDLDDSTAADLEVDVSAPSLQPVGKYFDYALPDAPMRITALLQGTPRAFRAEPLEITLGDSNLSGKISVDLNSKPTINAVLESNYLDLSWPFKAEDVAEPEKTQKETGNEGFLIPDIPIASARLDLADSDITIRVDKSKLANMTLHDIYLHSVISDGNLLLNPFQIRDEEGAVLEGSLAIRQDQQSGQTDMSLSMHGSGVRLGLGMFEGQAPDTYPQSDISVDLSGAGATYRDLAASLNGQAEVVRGRGLTGVTGLQLIFGNFITEAINIINPFTKTEKYTVSECAVAVVNVESGLLIANPVVVQTDKMTVVAEGEVDLGTEKILFTFNTKLRKGTGISASMVVNPFISITGTLLKPVIGLDPAAVAVKGSVAVATMGISLLARSLADRYFSSKDPCGDALKKAREKQDSNDK